MEGELCCLPDIVRVCKMYGAYVWLDEAHSIGAVGPTGRGVCEELGVDPADVDIMMGTFTKSFEPPGYVAGDHETVARVRQYAAGCTDAVSMPPAVCTQILASLRVIAGEDGTDIGATKLRQLRDNAKFSARDSSARPRGSRAPSIPGDARDALPAVQDWGFLAPGVQP